MANADDGNKEDLASRALRVLYVEDAPADADLTLQHLKKAGFHVTADVVAAPEEFQEKLHSKPYDIVLSDYRLPNWSGMDALKMVREQFKNIPFILVTGTLGDETAVECIKEGATDFVLKDHLSRLPLAFRRALEEKALREERDRAHESILQLASIVESSDDAIMGKTLAGTITSWNAGAERIYGYSANEVLGRSISILVPPDRAEEVPQILEKLNRGEHIHNYETVRVGKDGKRIDMSVTVSPVKDSSGQITGLSIIGRDITERKVLEDQLRQAQKMEAVGRLAGGVAHDFNNLLTIITGYSQLVLDRMGTGGPLRGHVEEVKKAADRAVTLTRQLLAFSRRQVLQPRVLNLNTILTDIEKMLRRMIGEDINLVTVPARTLGTVRADPGQIEQVILNLAVNARDAMPQGGKLTIETADVDLTEAYAQTRFTVTPGRYVMLAVSDNGVGMDAETQSHIFEPFFTTKDKDKGTGLGLATVYGIVKQSGGYIWVYSEPGKGTTFKIYLPSVDENVQAQEAHDAALIPTAGSETILLVEDEAALRFLVRGVLKNQGYKVLEASQPDEALKICESHKGPIHLMVTDVIMPKMSGWDLAKHLARLRPETKVLYLSGYTGASVARKGLLESGVPFLQKPFAPQTLARKVRELLDAAPPGGADDSKGLPAPHPRSSANVVKSFEYAGKLSSRIPPQGTH